MIHGKSADDYQHLGKYISALFLYNTVLRLLLPMTMTAPFYMFRNVSIGQITPLENNSFIDYMGGLQKVKGEKQYFLWIWIRKLENERKYKYLRDTGEWTTIRDSRSKGTLEELQTQTKFQIEFISYDLVDYENIIGLYSNASDGNVYMVANPKKSAHKTMIYQIASYEPNTDSYQLLPMHGFRAVLISH